MPVSLLLLGAVVAGASATVEINWTVEPSEASAVTSAKLVSFNFDWHPGDEGAAHRCMRFTRCRRADLGPERLGAHDRPPEPQAAGACKGNESGCVEDWGVRGR